MRPVSYVRCKFQQRTIKKIITKTDAIAALVFYALPHCQGSHISGLFEVDVEKNALDLCLDPSAYAVVLNKLADLSVIEWDAENHIVYIPGEWQRQAGRNGTGEIIQKNAIRGATSNAAQYLYSPTARQFIADHSLDVVYNDYTCPVRIPGRGWAKQPPQGDGIPKGSGCHDDGVAMVPPYPTIPNPTSPRPPNAPKSFEDLHDEHS